MTTWSGSRPRSERSGAARGVIGWDIGVLSRRYELRASRPDDEDPQTRKSALQGDWRQTVPFANVDGLDEPIRGDGCGPRLGSSAPWLSPQSQAAGAGQ